MCLWDVQILIMRLYSCFGSKMSLSLSKKFLKYLPKKIMISKNKFVAILEVSQKFLPHPIFPRAAPDQETSKNSGKFYFLKSGIFFDEYFKIFLEWLIDVLFPKQDDSLITRICTSHRHIPKKIYAKNCFFLQVKPP